MIEMSAVSILLYFGPKNWFLVAHESHAGVGLGREETHLHVLGEILLLNNLLLTW